MVVGDAAVQPLALKDLHAAEPRFHALAIQPHLEPMPHKSGRNAVQRALGPQQAVLADPRIEFLEVARAALRQRPQTRSLDFPGTRAARIEPANDLGDEPAVGGHVIELACATQQQGLLERPLEAALA